MSPYRNRKDEIELIWIFFLAIALVAVLGVGLLRELMEYQTQATCSRCGWPEQTVTWRLEKYCVKEINETDHVRPVWWVLENDCLVD